MNPHTLDDVFCPYYTHAVELVGRRWSGAILRAVLLGKHRFNEIAAAIPGLSDRMLSERLKELEAEDILERLVADGSPARVSYCLTAKGEALHVVIMSLTGWAERWVTPEQTAGQQTA
ncbi:MAG: transcriptional regulator [Dehalococcoidia bacterium]|nr:transcriptional regulator [Dehalococcoidia bacterium]